MGGPGNQKTPLNTPLRLSSRVCVTHAAPHRFNGSISNYYFTEAVSYNAVPLVLKVCEETCLQRRLFISHVESLAVRPSMTFKICKHRALEERY